MFLGLDGLLLLDLDLLLGLLEGTLLPLSLLLQELVVLLLLFVVRRGLADERPEEALSLVLADLVPLQLFWRSAVYFLVLFVLQLDAVVCNRILAITKLRAMRMAWAKG